MPGPDRIEIRLSGGIALSDAGSKALASLPVTRAVVDANHEADLRVSFARIDQNGADGGTRDVPLTLPAAGFGAGKAYDVVLKFTSTQITPQATISPWEEAGDRIEVIL